MGKVRMTLRLERTRTIEPQRINLRRIGLFMESAQPRGAGQVALGNDDGSSRRPPADCEGSVRVASFGARVFVPVGAPCDNLSLGSGPPFARGPAPRGLGSSVDSLDNARRAKLTRLAGWMGLSDRVA